MRRDEGNLQHGASPEWIEAIVDAILPEEDVHAGRAQLADSCRAAANQAPITTSLEDQVGDRVRSDRNPGSEAFVDDAIGVVVPSGGQRTNVTSANPAGKSSAQRLVSDHLESPHATVIGLVHVHVEIAIEALGQLEALADVLP